MFQAIRFLAPIAAALLVPLAAAQSIEQSVTEILAQADDGAVSIWDAGLRISDIDAQEDALARVLESAGASAGPKGKLAAAVGLREIADGDVFGKHILGLVKPVASGGSPDDEIAAVTILSDTTLFNRRLMPEIRELLADKVDDDLAEPRVRIAAARGLWSAGNETEQLRAKRSLDEFLQSRDRGLRIEAALALAEINTDSNSPGWDVLREIADEPTPEGRLARSYLSREEERRLFNRRLREIILQNLEEGTPTASGDDRFAELREIMLMVETQHVRGEDYPEDYLIDSAARGMLEGLDRHSNFFSSDEFQRFFFDLNREYGGIGAFVNFDRDNVFSIVRPIYSGPAYAAGLKSGDKILEVDGWETSGHTSEEIISRLKGEPDTTVVLKIIRAGLQEPQDVAVVRQQIRVPSVNWEMLPGNVGYIELVNFAQSTSDELRDAVTELTNAGAVGLMLDVRNNTGGYLLAARDVVELFVPGRKLVVYTQGRDPDDRFEYRTRDRAIAPDIPLVVLVNEYSASASEITAGALQDHGRATIVGVRTFGKGSVQQLLPLRSKPAEPFEDNNDNGQWDEWEPYEDVDGDGMYDVGPHVKLTVARYHLPSGRSLHKDVDRDGKVLNPDWGVSPDVEIELREVSVKDAWKNAEIFDLFQKGAFQTYVRDHIEGSQDAFLQIADGDMGRTDLYPDFEEFYAGLDTHLSTDDVRRWLRYTIRDEVADLRGKAYPGGRALGDPQEDAQLQEGVRKILGEIGQDIREVPAYRDVLKIDFPNQKTATK
jgi:C-terminal peptidase prc